MVCGLEWIQRTGQAFARFQVEIYFNLFQKKINLFYFNQTNKARIHLSLTNLKQHAEPQTMTIFSQLMSQIVDAKLYEALRSIYSVH